MQSLRQDERDVAGSVTCPARPEWLVPLRACAVAGRSQVGGKAAGLGRMMAAGLPVPEGVCLTSAAFEAFRTGTPVGQVIAEALQAIQATPVATGKLLRQIRAAIEVAACAARPGIGNCHVPT